MHFQGVGGDIASMASCEADTGDRRALLVSHGYFEVEELAFLTWTLPVWVLPHPKEIIS